MLPSPHRYLSPFNYSQARTYQSFVYTSRFYHTKDLVFSDSSTGYAVTLEIFPSHHHGPWNPSHSLHPSSSTLTHPPRSRPSRTYTHTILIFQALQSLKMPRPRGVNLKPVGFAPPQQTISPETTVSITAGEYAKLVRHPRF